MPVKQAFDDSLCSRWFPGTVNPAHKGWYEVRGPRFNGFLRLLWNGDRWEYLGPAHSDPDFPNFGAYQGDEWRGITSEEHHRDRNKNPKPRNMAGVRFGMIEAVQPEYVLPNGGGYHWRFICDCGREFVSSIKWVRAGNSASCGCMRHKKKAIKVSRPWDRTWRPNA